jgi:hypothetical protein
MLSQTSYFPCPNCNEIVSSESTSCKYCKREIDAHAADAAIKLQERINHACNDASMVRNLAGFMWIMFAVQFLFAFMGRLLFFGLMVGVPVMLIKWQFNYGDIRTSDVDFRSAKRNRNLALLLWAPTPVLIVVVIVVLVIAQSTIASS